MTDPGGEMFFNYLCLLCLVLISSFSWALWADYSPSHFDWQKATIRCATHASLSKELFREELRGQFTLLELEDKFLQIYHRDERIGLHAFFDSEKELFIAPLRKGHKTFPVPLTQQFIANVARHLEIAIEEGYADFVFLPDMGHAHLYFPENHWNQEYANMPSGYKNQHKLYQKMLADPKLKSLYHLSEQLMMRDHNKHVLPDKLLHYKYWNRNFVGYNDGTTHFEMPHVTDKTMPNSVASLPRHKLWSAGFAVSANKNGCFPYRDKDGQTRFFDIAMQDPRYNPNTNVSEFD